MSSLNRIFVGGLRDTTHRSEIENYFKQFGRIKKVFMPTVRLDKKKGPLEPDNGLSPAKYSVLGYVFIKFYKSASAEKCVEAGLHEIGGKKIDVERAYIIEGSVNEALSKLQLKLFFRGFPADTPRSRPVSRRRAARPAGHFRRSQESQGGGQKRQADRLRGLQGPRLREENPPAV